MSASSEKLRLGVLGSGSGSSMQGILDAIDDGALDAKIVLVLSDNADAFILKRAKNAGIPVGVIDCLGYKTRFPGESQKKVAEKLKSLGVDIVCLAGFMRMVGQPMLETFPRRILNIHPSLLPAYPGLMACNQALEDRADESGCTVHYVDAGMDTGDIILQARVPVLPGDTAGTLLTRIQVEERRIYPEAIQKTGVHMQ